MENAKVMNIVDAAIGFYTDIEIDEYLGDTRVRMGEDRHCWSRQLLETLSRACHLHNLDYYVKGYEIVIYPQSKAMK